MKNRDSLWLLGAMTVAAALAWQVRQPQALTDPASVHLVSDPTASASQPMAVNHCAQRHCCHHHHHRKFI